MAKHRSVFCIVIALTLAVTTVSLTDVPQLISFQGKLQDHVGNPLTGTYQITFRIYSVASGGTSLWAETGSVNCDNGLYNVILGLITPMTLGFDGDYWLGVQVAGDSELSPRFWLVSVPTAFRAQVANEVSWTNLTDVPAGFADGVDDVGSSGGGISQINAGTGIMVTNPTGPTTTVAANVGAGASQVAAGNHDHDAYYVNEGQANSITSSMIVNGTVQQEDLSFIPGTDSDWTINGNMIYHETGNVGIGTATPAYELDVSGTVRSTNNSSDGMAAYGHASQEGSMGDSTANYGGYFQADGLWGIGVYGHAPSTAPNSSNPLDHNINYGGYFQADGLRGVGVYGRATASPSPGNNVNYGGYFQGDGAYATGVYGVATRSDGCGVRGVCKYHNGKGGDFEAYGSSGIGVQGTGSQGGGDFSGTGEYSYGIEASGSTYGVYCTSGSGTAGYFYSGTGHGLIVKQGNVGIGTESPTNILELSSSAPKLYFNRESSTSNLCGLYWRSAGDDFEGAFVRNNETGDIELYTNISGGTPRMAIKNDGKVGIKTVNPSYELSVIGDIGYTGNIYDVSDIRLKENITPLENAIAKVSSINSIYFNNMGESPEEREVGVIAQEVEKVLPEIVSSNAEGYKSVDYSKLTPLLIEAVKEQQAQIETLKAEVDRLKARLN